MENTITSKSKARNAYEKASLIAAYKASGLSKKEWCQKNDIGLRTLQRWLQQENKQGRQQQIQNWVPVIPAMPEQLDSLEIQIGNFKITVDAKTDKKLLSMVLGILVELC